METTTNSQEQPSNPNEINTKQQLLEDSKEDAIIKKVYDWSV